jgi:hypothetical protein
MNKIFALLAVAALAASAPGCGCCNCFRPAAPAVCAAPVPVCPPVAADPCSVPTTTYGYAPATGW